MPIAANSVDATLSFETATTFLAQFESLKAVVSALLAESTDASSTSSIAAKKPENAAKNKPSTPLSSNASFPPLTASPPPARRPARHVTPRRLKPTPVSSTALPSTNSSSLPPGTPDPFLRKLPSARQNETNDKSQVEQLQVNGPAADVSRQHDMNDLRERLETRSRHDRCRNAANYHARCIRAILQTASKSISFVGTLRLLIDCIQQQLLHVGRQTAKREIVSAVDDFNVIRDVVPMLNTFQDVALHAILTLRELSDVIEQLPSLILTAFLESPILVQYGDNILHLTRSTQDFPISDKPSWTPAISIVKAASQFTIDALENEGKLSVAKRLSSNLEACWDQLLLLGRQYRGEIDSVAPGTLDADMAIRTMAALHPANMDTFAARFIEFITTFSVQMRDAPPKMRQLGARMRSAANSRQTPGAAPGGNDGYTVQGKRAFAKSPSRFGQQQSFGVVLHRLPELVRKQFGDDLGELFFLDFLTGVDSAKLNAALIPRLAAAVCKTITAAAAATTNVAFTDAVFDARLFAKILSVTMHGDNWAHSPFSLSGGKGLQDTPGLGPAATAWRAAVHSATWKATIDLEALVEDAVKSRQVLAMIATIAVVDVVLRLASVDPIAKVSEWYLEAIDALRKVYNDHSYSSSFDSDSLISSLPLVRVMLFDLLQDAKTEETLQVGATTCNDESYDKMPNDWSCIGDYRFLQGCSPSLHALRRFLLTHRDQSLAAQKTAVRRITPLATQGSRDKTAFSTQQPPKSNQGARQKEQNRLGNGMTGSETADAQNSSRSELESALRNEFYTRMDGRLRELIGVVLSSKPKSADEAKQVYATIAKVLYPSHPITVVAVAAGMCGRRVAELAETGARTTESDQSVTDSTRLESDRKTKPVLTESS